MMTCIELDNSAAFCVECKDRAGGMHLIVGRGFFCGKCCPTCNANAEEPQQKRRSDGPFRFKHSNRKVGR
jgi:hypothetical protein